MQGEDKEETDSCEGTSFSIEGVKVSFEGAGVSFAGASIVDVVSIEGVTEDGSDLGGTKDGVLLDESSSLVDPDMEVGPELAVFNFSTDAGTEFDSKLLESELFNV